jgi:hypothetical protein
MAHLSVCSQPGQMTKMNRLSVAGSEIQENGSKKDPPLKFKVESIEVLESQGLLVQKDHLTSYILF